MSLANTTWFGEVVKRLTPVPLDGAAFLMNLFVATVGGMILGIISAGVLAAPFVDNEGVLGGLIGLVSFCFPAFLIGYVALRKFDQQSAMWTWAAGFAIWTCLVTIDLVNFDGQYCGLNRWQHLWADYIWPDSRGRSCIDEGLGWLFVTAPMLCNVVYSLGAIVASRRDASQQVDS